MPFNVRLNKPKKSGSSWLLNDQFKTARAAGSVDGTRAEPGPGTRRVADAGSTLAVRDGYLQTTASPPAGWRDPDCCFTPAGVIMAASFGLEAGGAMTWGPAMGIFPADRPPNPTATGLGVYLWDTGGPKPHFRAIPSGVTLQDVDIKINSVPYVFYIIRRPTGGAWIICSSPDANFGTGRLLWVDDTDDIDAATYLGMDVNEGMLKADFIRALAAGKLGAPFSTGYGPALAYDTFTRADGPNLGSTEGGGYAWTKIGACSIASGQMAPGELGGAVMSAGALPRIIDFDWVTPAAGDRRMGLLLRCPSSGAWASGVLVQFYDNVVHVYINGVNSGSALCATGAGTTHRVRVVDTGARLRVYLDNTAAAIDILSSVNNTQFTTGFERWTGDGGSLVDNFRIWPATVTPPALLGTYPAAPAGTGNAVFSDAMTGADSTALATHNAAWSTSGTGVWEINGNKARMTADGVKGFAVVESGLADHEISARVTTPNTEPADENDEWFCGLAARWADANNYIEARYIYTSSREIELWQIVDGAGLLIGMVKLPLTLAKNTEYTLKIAVKGQEAAVYHAGLLVIQTHTRPGAALGTKCGIGASALGGAGNRPEWDDVEVREA